VAGTPSSQVEEEKIIVGHLNAEQFKGLTKGF
jgi:hypothetical protein